MSDLRKWKALIESANKLTEDPVADADYTDHEVSMAKSQMLSSMKSINRIAKHLSTKSESEGLEGWTASKLTMAEDYLQVVADYFDGQEINEGYKVLPPMDKEKYQARDGLEGPFSTLSGKVVYYDPKAGKYYDPDTDMYMSYDEFRRYDDDYKGMKDERDEVKESGVAQIDFGANYGAKTDEDNEAIAELLQDGIQLALDGDYHSIEFALAVTLRSLKIYSKHGHDIDTPKIRMNVEKIMRSQLKGKVPERSDKHTQDHWDQLEEAHQIDWPDEDMEQHAYNAIRHDMHAYDAYGHVYSMTPHRDWMEANKDDIIKMFAQYGLQTESLEEADETKYGIIRYPDTAISYIKNDGNGWEHIFDKSYGFEGPVDKEDLQYAKKIAKEKIPSRMFEAGVNEGPFKGIGKQLMKRKLNKQYKKSDLANFDKSGIDTSGKTPDEVGQMKSDFYHDHMDKAARTKKAGDRLSGKNKVKESTEMMTEAEFDEAAGEKDACYHKVKSRYKVWPSAYASGALVKCRKVGAKNWGNSKKK